jgi:hypothetical protein
LSGTGIKPGDVESSSILFMTLPQACHSTITHERGSVTLFYYGKLWTRKRLRNCFNKLTIGKGKF